MTAIRVSHLGKKFKLFRSPGNRFREYFSFGYRKYHEDFWALKDITFEVPEGTTVGIIGQNGSGKSTLLSILAGVLEPSSGSFEINGKVSAILELGSGFHPEFSGRDNVYMYGSIMGLSQKYIEERFDKIAQFSELGDFIEQPLRTYSTGMIVRLAFSVAINVNPDILIVDEALAVGDVMFQHRCSQKIRELQAEGKTILYVGHDTEAVRNLCTYSILLDGGQIIERGDPTTVVNKYYALIAERERTYGEANQLDHGDLPGEGFEPIYDFIERFPEADVVSVEGIPIQAQTVEVFTPLRKVLYAHPPSVITYHLLVPPSAFLSFAIGILPDAWKKMVHGVKYDIDIVQTTRTDNVFSRILEPKRNFGDRGWHNFLISLENYAGNHVSIVFKTSGSGENLDCCWATWGWMKIVRSKASETVPVENLGVQTLGYPQTRIGNLKAQITHVELKDLDGRERLSYDSGEIGVLKFTIIFNEDMKYAVTAGCTIRSKYTNLYAVNTRWKKNDLLEKRAGDQVDIKIKIPFNFGTGSYSLTPAVAVIHTEGDVFSPSDVEIMDSLEDHIFFNVHHKNMIGTIDLGAEIEVLQNI